MRYAERLKRHLKQTVIYEKRDGVNAYNKPVFAPKAEIPARVELKSRLVRNSLGNEVLSDTTVYCQTDVQPLDRVDGRDVISVASMVDGGGNICGYEVYL